MRKRKRAPTFTFIHLGAVSTFTLTLVCTQYAHGIILHHLTLLYYYYLSTTN